MHDLGRRVVKGSNIFVKTIPAPQDSQEVIFYKFSFSQRLISAAALFMKEI